MIGWYYRAPGGLALWLGLAAGAWLTQAPVLSGVDPKTRNPAPEGAGEERAQRRYRVLSKLKWSLLAPVSLAQPGWPLFGSWIAAVFAGLVTASAPHDGLARAVVGISRVMHAQSAPAWTTGPAAHGVAGVLGLLDGLLVAWVIAAYCAATRAADASPGVRLDTLRSIAIPPADREAESLREETSKTPSVIAWCAVGLGTFAGLGLGTHLALSHWGGLLDLPALAWLWPPLLAACGALSVAAWPWSQAALAEWRLMMAARSEWGPRWDLLAEKAPPVLQRREFVGRGQHRAVVDHFRADGSRGAAPYYAMADKIANTFGSGTRIAVLTSNSLDKDGQPQPGTTDNIAFRVVAWPSDYYLPLADANAAQAAGEAVMRLWLECSLGWVFAGAALPPEIDTFELLPTASAASTQPTEDETPRADAPGDGGGDRWLAWAVTFHGLGTGWETLRQTYLGGLAGYINGEALADDQWGGGRGRLYVGALTAAPDGSELPEFDPSGTEVTRTHFANLDVEDGLSATVWSSVLKTMANHPTPYHDLYAEREIAPGQVVHRRVFIVRNGDTNTNYFKYGSDPALAGAMGAVPFLAITGFVMPGGRNGERHPTAFSMIWSDAMLPPNPDTLAPLPNGAGRPAPGAGRRPGRGGGQRSRSNEGHLWVLAGRLNQAFAGPRLAQPEVYAVQCLTTPDSRGHIWAMKVRLFGGVTLADVRGAAQRLRQTWGSQWLRVEAAPDGCVIVAGASPHQVTFATAQDEQYAARLDWEQAFLIAKITGEGGLTPNLVALDRLPDNEKVQVLDFDLPPGVTLGEVKAVRAKLEQASGNAYVEPRAHPSRRPDQVQIMACETNPMPERVGYDFEYETDFVPIGVGVEGRAIEIDFTEDPHVMLLGLSGSGKSAAASNLVYGAIARGFDVYVIDVQKGAADFKFASDMTLRDDDGNLVFGTDHLAGIVAGSMKTEDYVAAEAMMKAVYAEVQRRVALNSEFGVPHVTKLPPHLVPPPILLFLDEFLGLIETGAKPATRPLEDPELEQERLDSIKRYNAKLQILRLADRMGAEARSADVHLVLATQKLKQDSIQSAPSLKVNLARIILGKSTQGDRMSALRDFENAPALGDYIPKGRGLWESVTETPRMIQFWYADSPEYARRLRESIEPVPMERRIDYTPYLPKSAPGNAEVFGAVIGEPDLDGAIIPSTAQPPTRPPAPVEVVETEMTFSLDDWDLDSPSPTVEQPETTASADGSEDPDAVLDWDLGAPAPAPPVDPLADALDWDLDGTAQANEPEPHEVPDAALGGEVEIADTVVWDEIDPSGWMPAGEGEWGWPEIDALLAFLEDFPEVREVHWSDPRLNALDALGIPFADVVADLLADRHVAFHPPAPAAAGLVPDTIPVHAAPGEPTTWVRPVDDFLG